ncbi:MAG: rhodanese-like domain-containing protein [Gammaproteobacteria bacterium]|nr:rhodanese-like domain-containing protein [Gammaproteobacteria bacterium]
MGQLIEFTNNNPLLVTGTLLMGLAVLFYELRLRGRQVFEVTTAQAVQMINKGAKVIDLREQKDFAAGHIVDAVNVPTQDLAAGNDRRLKKNKTLILVCDNGIASGRQVEPLRKAGFENAYSLSGGLSGWRRENLPVITD